MIKTSDVIEFFDRLAPEWDAEMIRNEEVISTILDHACVSRGKTVLDVACGTGVLIQDYLDREVSRVTAVDISPRMMEIARSKFTDPRIHFICGDVETADYAKPFDCIMVYNAFPHFPDQERLIARLASLLNVDGQLSIAHGMSRKKIDQHHHGAAKYVSNGLMPVIGLQKIMGKYVEVTTAVSNEKMYLVTGRRWVKQLI